jgi:hypothetical protein
MQYPDRKHILLTALAFFGIAGLITLSSLFFSSFKIETGFIQRIGGLSLMIVSFILLVRILGPLWSGSLAVLYVGMLTIYHGASEFLAVIFNQENDCRALLHLDPALTAKATLIAGSGIFILVAGYMLSYSRKSTQVQPVSLISRGYEWLFSCNLILLVAWFLVAFAIRLGMSAYIPASARYWVTSFLGGHMFYILLIMVLLRVFAEWKRERINGYALAGIVIPIILMCALFMNMGRVGFLIFFIPFLFLLSRWNLYKVSLRVLLIGSIFLALLFSFVSEGRAMVGRQEFGSGNIFEKTSLYLQIFIELTTEEKKERLNIYTEAGCRADANLLLGELAGQVPMAKNPDMRPYMIPVRMMIPSSLWPAKLQLDEEWRSVETYLHNNFIIPDHDVLPTPLTVFFASGGMILVVVIMFLTGLFLGYIERVAWNCTGIWCGSLTTGLSVGFAHIEGQIQGFGYAVRSGLIMSVVFLTIFFITNQNQTKRFDVPVENHVQT